MDFLIEFIFGVICYRVGFGLLRIITFGRFTGKSSYWPGLVGLLGALVLFSPFIAFVTWKIVMSAGH